MKLIKKTLCIILCLIMALSCCILASATAKKDYDHLPQVYVAGFESRRIYFKDDPAKTMLFPLNSDLMISNLKKFGDYTAEGLKKGETDIIYNYLYSAFYDTLGPYALKGDGITGANENVVCESASFGSDGDGFYYFTYDSRLSPIDLAEQLHEYIKKVQEDSGSERFELVGASYGTTIVMAYLNEHPEMHKYIDSLLLSIPSYGGFSVVGEIFSGDFYVDHDTLTQYAYVGLNNNDLGLFLSVLNKSGVLKPLLEWFLLPAVKAIALEASRDIARDTIGTLPSIWTFVPSEYFEASMKNVYGENYTDPNHEYAGVISKAIYYKENIQDRLDEIYLTAQNNGIKMNITCKYGKPPMPISKKGSFMSDGSVDVKDVTLGATASKYGEILPADYKQAMYPKYNFISPDWCIDASTGVDPIHTWYIRGLDHREQSAGFSELIDYIVYEDPDVFSSDKFPQYTYATSSGGLAPVTAIEEKEETTFFEDFTALTKRLYELASTAIKENLGK